MIPKIIHYCWFGNNPMPHTVLEYIETWKKFCPDYKIIEWNEGNFPIDDNIYCNEAYKAKKWAFVTDYVRLKVLYEYGGFYMDTDVEVVKSLDPLRVFDAVSGYESNVHIQTGIIGSEANNEWIGMLLDDYAGRHFRKDNGDLDLTTNVITITKLTKEKYKLDLDGYKKIFGKNNVILPFEYLCAKSLESGKVVKTNNTYTIHHFAGSWLSDDDKEWHRICFKVFSYMKWIPNLNIREKIVYYLSVIIFLGPKKTLRKMVDKMVMIRRREK